MTCRLVRFAATGFCLASLIACAGTCFLWWQSHRRVQRVERLEVARGGWFVEATHSGTELRIPVAQG